MSKMRNLRYSTSLAGSEEDSCEELETLSATGNLLLPDGEEETTGPDGVSSEYKQNDEDSPILHGTRGLQPFLCLFPLKPCCAAVSFS